MTFDEIFDSIKDIPGWMGFEDCEVLHKYASKVKGTIVEIGCYAGRSTTLLALSSPKSEITTIDSMAMGNVEGELMENIKGLRVDFIRKHSSEAGAEWIQPIDLLFIDGDHSFKQVMEDIELFVPCVRSGSYVLFHDYNTECHGRGLRGELRFTVKRAINKLSDRFFSSVQIEQGIAVCKKI